MLNNLFRGVFDTSTQTVISPSNFLLCIGTALFIGLLLSFVYTYKSKYTKSFVVTLAMLPAIVCVIIMMVNGNIGAGVAVAGSFSLVRFRSVPGTAKEIGAIFLAMGAGLITGMGYLSYGLLFAVILGLIDILYVKIGLGEKKHGHLDRTMDITIPENLNYTEVFTDLLEKYTSNYELIRVKTTNMGSLFKLTYHLTLNKSTDEKKFIDELRCRNGNLEISSSIQENSSYEL